MLVATTSATMSAAGFFARRSFTGTGRGKRGKFLGQFLRAAVRTLGGLPVHRTDEDFAVALALFAMKFVNRHEGKITGAAKMFKPGLNHEIHETHESNSAALPAAFRVIRVFRGFPCRIFLINFAHGAFAKGD